MPNKLYINSNQRIDKEDFDLASYGYTQESIKLLHERLTIDTYSRLVQGFRVSISDQTGSPGEITVYNGLAIDRAGQLIRDEDQVQSSASITLSGASATFYVEVEFVESLTSTDGRAFWDPTVTNTAPIPDGAEVALSANTRSAPKWQIVSPVSTTGFDRDSDRNSTRIPLCVLTTNGSNEITTVDTLVYPAASVMKLAESGDTTLEVSDATIFSLEDATLTDIDTATTQTVTITAIDYDNNVLTVSPSLSADFNSGSTCILDQGTSNTFVAETEDPNDSRFGLAVTSQPNDQANRLYQGDEHRGIGVITSKYDSSLRSDVDINNVKDHVDSLAALIREMKFGHPRPTNTSSSPILTASATPRWVDSVPGILPSRMYDVTIGDGTSSFGDFNGTDETTFIAAFSTIPNGGRVLVKEGSYTISTGIDLSSYISGPVVIEGVSKDAVSIDSDNNATGAIVATQGDLTFRDITTTISGTSTYFFGEFNDALVIDNCVVAGVAELGASPTIDFIVSNSTFTGPVALSSPINRFSVVNCVSTFDSTAERLFTVGSSCEAFLIEQLLMSGNSSSLMSITGNVKALSVSNVSFNTLSGTASTAFISLLGKVTGLFQNIHIEDFPVNATTGFVNGIITSSGTDSTLVFDNINLSASFTGSGAVTKGFQVQNASLSIFKNSKISFDAAQTRGINVLDGPQFIENCYLSASQPIYVSAADSKANISGCRIVTPPSVTTWSGITNINVGARCHISNTVFEDLGSVSTLGVCVDSQGGETIVSDCSFINLGSGSFTGTFYGINHSGTTLQVSNCSFDNMDADTGTSGLVFPIFIDDAVSKAIINNCSFDTISGNAVEVRDADSVNVTSCVFEGVTTCVNNTTGAATSVTVNNNLFVSGSIAVYLQGTSNSIVSNNIIDPGFGVGLGVILIDTVLVHCVVSNNVAKQNNAANSFQIVIPAGTNFCAVTGNVSINSGAGAGLEISGGGGGSVSHAAGNVTSNNAVYTATGLAYTTATVTPANAYNS